MVIVSKLDSVKTKKCIVEQLNNEITQEEVEAELVKREEGEFVKQDYEFVDHSGKIRYGYYLDSNLKYNLENYLIKAVKKKWDAAVLITGGEGSAKSTNACTFAKFVDPTFPGKKLDDGTGRRSCARIVFTQQQFMEAVDSSGPGKAIVWDEMVLGGLAQDAAKEAQKVLIKKMVTIRKKRLYIFFVLPSIFMLRMYFGVFRTRALIHFYTPDGVSRGYFKFYSYDTKRKLFIRGRKEYNQDAVRPDFQGRCTNTLGYFFDEKEYDLKKEAAIRQITEAPEKDRENTNKKLEKLKTEKSMLLYMYYNSMCDYEPKLNVAKFKKYIEARVSSNLFKVSEVVLREQIRKAEELEKDDALIKEALRNKAIDNAIKNQAEDDVKDEEEEEKPKND